LAGYAGGTRHFVHRCLAKPIPREDPNRSLQQRFVFRLSRVDPGDMIDLHGHMMDKIELDCQ
jgi:hypothetical protein